MLDPVAVATITSAVSVLGSEYIKGIASEAGKGTWVALRSAFGWAKDPALADIPHEVATKLIASPEITIEVLALLKRSQGAGAAASIVGKIDAEKVIVIQNMHGNVQM